MGKILAHTSDKNPETLHEHSKKTLEYCELLIEKMGLEYNIKEMLAELVSKNTIPLFLELIRSVVCNHDLGKINPAFQKEKMRNEIDVDTEGMDTTHSFYGKILFDNIFFDNFCDNLAKLNDDKKKTSQFLFFLLTHTIDRHHSNLKDIDSLSQKINEKSDVIEDLYNIAKDFFEEWSKIPIQNLSKANMFKDGEWFELDKLFDTEQKKEALFYLYKTVYSLLIMSDYYATLEYMQGTKFIDSLSIMTPEIQDKCNRNFYRFDFNQRLQDKKYCKEKLESDIENITELNDLREKILLESDDKLEKALKEKPEQRVFYLNVPTGGGKTNISLKLVLTLLKLRRTVKRVFYVFPFINIIEQNHAVIKDTFGLDEELSSIYSTSAWSMSSEEKEERLKFVLDNEFLNHPFVVMSNVNFFNTFIKSGKTSNYRLINLSNSIVILDEIQSLDDKSWTLFNDLIEYGSKYLNIHFIIMSATLPNLEMLSDTKINFVSNLINEPKKIFEHDLFKKRVCIEYREDVKDLDKFIEILKDELKFEQHTDKKKILLVVNTIKTSLDLYKKITSDDDQIFSGFEICLLNSTILSYRRTEIINKMKQEDSKIILVSTQSVEAGVDIDCDFGIRDFGIFDSIEQIAGRINRNFTDIKHTAKLIITNLHKEGKKISNFIYEDSYRWDTIGKEFSTDKEITEFLERRDFTRYYEKVLENIRSIDNSPIRKSSMSVVKNGIRRLDFSELDQVDIIKDNSISLLVNYKLPRTELSTAESNFIDSTNSDHVSGRYVWSKYNEFISNFKKGHIDRKIDTRIWSSILSKFSINISNRKPLNKIGTGIHLLKDEFYSVDEGLDPTILHSDSLVKQ